MSKQRKILIAIGVISLGLIILYMMQQCSGFRCKECEGFDVATSTPQPTPTIISTIGSSNEAPPDLVVTTPPAPTTNAASSYKKQGSQNQDIGAQLAADKKVMAAAQEAPKVSISNASAAMLKPGSIVVDEATLYKNLVSNTQFGPPLGNSVSPNQKLTNITDAFHTELNRIVNMIPQADLNTPVGTLLGPQIMNESMANLFPKTSIMMQKPLKDVLNPNISIGQIADQLQPPRVTA